MANNYDRLFSELTSLLADEDVLQRIDEALGERIRSVLKNHQISETARRRRVSPTRVACERDIRYKGDKQLFIDIFNQSHPPNLGKLITNTDKLITNAGKLITNQPENVYVQQFQLTQEVLALRPDTNALNQTGESDGKIKVRILSLDPKAKKKPRAAKPLQKTAGNDYSASRKENNLPSGRVSEVSEAAPRNEKTFIRYQTRPVADTAEKLVNNSLTRKDTSKQKKMVRKMDSGKITAIKGCGERTVGEINSSGICEEKTKTASFRDGRRFRTEISTGKDSNGKSQTGQEESLHLKEIKFLQYIEQKQLQADFEKNSLELKIKELRRLMDQERQQQLQVQRDIQWANEKLTKTSVKCRAIEDLAYSLKKKLLACASETKDIINTRQADSEQNLKLREVIQEQKELISMYTIVIEEIKGQIKVEQELRNSLRKQLSRKQKNEMALIHRRKYTQGSTESIMRSVNDSINKWV